MAEINSATYLREFVEALMKTLGTPEFFPRELTPEEVYCEYGERVREELEKKTPEELGRVGSFGAGNLERNRTPTHRVRKNPDYDFLDGKAHLVRLATMTVVAEMCDIYSERRRESVRGLGCH